MSNRKPPARGADYLIVGAGTAGCTVARRLAEAGAEVILLEAGGSDLSPTLTQLMLTMPAGLRSIFKPSSGFNSWYRTEPQPHLDGRRIDQPRGRVLGGSSSINGMTFLRGHPKDYDAWADEHGCIGWRWAEVEPYFRRLEGRRGPPSPARGAAGPVSVTRVEALAPLSAAFLEAGRQAGFDLVEDFNAAPVAGVGRFDMSVADGRRSSASRAYLHRAPRPEGLQVVTGRRIVRLVFERDRAVGVSAVDESGGLETIYAGREVILAAGVFATPQILMLSGVGPEAALRAVGLRPRIAAPGVGENLHDHLEAHIQVETDLPISLNRYMRPHLTAWAGLQWLVAKTGPAAVNQCHVGAFLASAPAFEAWPDVQMHFFPIFFGPDWLPDPKRNGWRLGCGTMRPASRGRVFLQSDDPADAPAIDPAYLSAESDRLAMRRALELGREILGQPAFATFRGREASPGSDLKATEDLDRFIRLNAASAYHPCGTVRMGGATDDLAPLDPMLRVKGVDRLRVVDASAMPAVPSANINAAGFMLAEKAADLISGSS
ncbi:MAG: FAD-dependent oxidoreductase [Marivibrio sp.]|uniref:GMC family oxidoreductase N-terminal domain-containing protein n=1 Tax=Marivibrio sp. TaxID=2039719 RepID=UPI0032EE5566